MGGLSEARIGAGPLNIPERAVVTTPEIAPILSPTPATFSVLVSLLKGAFLVGEIATLGELTTTAEVEGEIARWV